MTERRDRILVLALEDEPDHALLLGAHLPDGYELLVAPSLAVATAMLDQGVLPDVAVIDLRLPDGSGVDFAHQLRRRCDAATLVCSASLDLEEIRSAVAAGVHGYLRKPIDHLELVVGIENALRLRDSERVSRRLTRMIEERLEVQTDRLVSAQEEALLRLAAVAEKRDPETGEHLERIAVGAERLALAVGLPPEQARVIRLAAPMHDIGKIALPDELLYDPTTFDDDRRAAMAQHTVLGWEILAGSDNPILQVAARIARHHHERVDGTGGPDGLAGDAIPLEARITAVVDVHDALTHARRYKPAFDHEQTAQAMRADPGHLDQGLVDLHLTIAERAARAEAEGPEVVEGARRHGP